MKFSAGKYLLYVFCKYIIIMYFIIIYVLYMRKFLRHLLGFLSGFRSRGVKMRYNGFLGGQVLSSWKESIWIPRASINTCMFHCAKHNQHANARGVWGHAPQKNFEK